MIQILIIVSICWVLAAICNAVMDTLDHHYTSSIFIDFKNQQYWDPVRSWRNKWKNGNKEEGEKFWGSSTIFVWTTDAWHFFQQLMLYFLQFSIAVPLVVFMGYSNFMIIPIVLILKIGWGGPFELFYKYILINNGKSS